MSQADSILEEIGEIDLFHDNLSQGYARIEVDGHTETLPIKGKHFGLWLRHKYHSKTGKSPNSDAVRTAQDTIEAKALFDAEERNVELRVAKVDGVFWYDLADKDWRSVKIAPDGWAIEAAPAFFRRYGVTKRQLEPSRNGNLLRLLDFINFQEDTEQVDAKKALFLIYVVTCLVPDIV